jgi:GxxExxY protein
MEINQITEKIIGAAIKVHSLLGPGLFEQVYKACLFRELQKQSIKVAKEVMLPVLYDCELIDLGYRLDLLVESEVIVELKAIERLTRVHRTQVLTYLKLSHKTVGLLINFNAVPLKDGIVRIVRGYAGPKPSAVSVSPR